MKRAPIVLVATAAGLAGVLAFHTSPTSLAVGAATGAGAGTSPGTTSGTTGTSSGASSSAGSTSGTGTATSAPPSTTTTTPGGTRTATGELVNYNYGILSVSVTANGKRITNVKIASINEGGNQLSQSIDQQSIPTLEQETLQSQNGNIQSVAGASYTSAGFTQSLQSALNKLGLK